MKSDRESSRILLVEGADEKRLFPQLLERMGIDWCPPPVYIDDRGGLEQILKPGVVEAYLKSSGLKSLGIVLDADQDPSGRWRRLHSRLGRLISDFPSNPREHGVVCGDSSEIRVGAWMMPDNSNKGMLETFLQHLIPYSSSVLKDHAIRATDEAANLGAPYKISHVDKARIHSWLAWQDPPGLQLHIAVLKRHVESCGPLAEAFCGWFRAMFLVK